MRPDASTVLPLPVHNPADRLPAFVSVLLATIALALPMLVAYNLPPSATFLNQAAALIGWGGWLTVLAGSMHGPAWPPRAAHGGPGAGPLAALQVAMGLLLLASLASPLWTQLPWSLALSGAGLIAAAMLAAQVAAALRVAGRSRSAFRAFCIGMVVAGVASCVVGIVQVYLPAWADGDWIARSGIPGRAVGNMRQPNHLSSLLLWSLIAVVWLGDSRLLRRGAVALIGLLLVFGVVLSGSRTGALGVGMLAMWGLLDKRLSRPARWMLVLAPVAYGLLWLGASAWADHSHQVFGGETRFTTKGDISSSRYGIWSNTLALIRMHPWVGVGFGEFNFAWTLTPFPGRPVAFFDHTHNLPLQFAVEMGLPLAGAVLALLAWALWGAFARAKWSGTGANAAGSAPDGTDCKDGTDDAPMLRAAFVMVLMVLVHSLLEYPLWYAYFLLPAAFAFGLCLAGPAQADVLAAGPAAEPASGDAPTRLPPEEATRPLLIAALLLMLGSMGSVADYVRVVVIFAPPDNAPPLAQRIDEGRRSVFFAHHADYAAATTTEHPSQAMASFLRAPHYLLDSRLMTAWATALNEAGDTEHARYIAQRLKEFRNEQAAPFFAPCDAPASSPPFQCVLPARGFVYEDFR